MDTSKRWHKTYASILEWQWFKDPYKVQLWEALRALASISKVQGEVTTTLSNLVRITGQDRKTILKHLRLLQETGEIVYKPEFRKTIITITNWKKYQGGGTIPPTSVESIPIGGMNTPTSVESIHHFGGTIPPHYIDIENIYIPSSSSSGCAHAREGEGKLWMELVADEKFWNDAHKMLGLEIAKLKEYAKEFDEEMWAKKKSWKGGFEDYAAHCVSWIRRKLELSHTTYTPGTRGKGQQHQPRPSLDSSGNPIDRIAVAKANAQQNAAERRYKASREEMNELVVHYPTLDLKDRESVANALEEIRRRKKK